MARSKLTDELLKNFQKAMRLGLTTKAACDYCGISDVSYYKYIKRAEEDIESGKKNTKYVRFLNTVKKAKADFRAFHMAQIQKASESGAWQASAWALERCYPDEYGRQVKVEASDGIVKELLDALRDDEET